MSQLDKSEIGRLYSASSLIKQCEKDLVRVAEARRDRWVEYVAVIVQVAKFGHISFSKAATRTIERGRHDLVVQAVA